MSKENHDAGYIAVWGILLVAMIASIVLVEISHSGLVIATIFVIATIKAALVVSRFMHLTREPGFLQTAFAGALAIVAIFFLGVFPDVGKAWSVIPEAEYQDREDNAAFIASVSAGAAEGPADASKGAKVYATYCQGCHQADGKGNNGTIAANLVEDKERMSQSDEVLLKSIQEGKTGKIGTMPPWGSVITAQQQKDVLAYIRSLGGS